MRTQLKHIFYFLNICMVPIIVSSEAFAAEKDDLSPWQVRFRAINIMPDESASISSIGGNAKISNRAVPEIDISYFFTQNISAELVLATAKHDVKAIGTTSGTVDLGSVWHLPPTLLAQYQLYS